MTELGWQYRERGSGGAGNMQRVTQSSTPTPEEQQQRWREHVVDCLKCRESTDGSCCSEGFALWSAAERALS